MSQTLSEQIDVLIQEKTFSLEAVEAIKTLKDKYNTLVTAQAILQETLNEKIRINSNLITNLEAISKENTDYKLREHLLKDKEDKQARLECKAEKFEAVAEAYKDALKTVFKNPIVQSAVLGNTPLAMNGYTQNAPFNQTTVNTTNE